MKVLVISGFLGAGKTTFIKELIRKTGKSPVILENEYGQNNLDSQDIENDAPLDLQLLDFMEGCVCCSQKDKFSNTILTISAGIDPEYLVVEPTGVGKLSNILAAINKVSWEKTRLLKPVVVLAPRTFDLNMAEFGDIYEDQIRHTGTVVFSKVEHEDPAVIAYVSERVKRINPDCNIITNHYSTQDLDWWNSLFLEDGEALAIEAEEDEDNDMMHVSLQKARLSRPAELIMLLEDLLRGEFGLVVRAKGVLKVGQEWLRFDLADQCYGIIAERSENPETQCVFIGKNIDEARLWERLYFIDSTISTKKVAMAYKGKKVKM